MVQEKSKRQSIPEVKPSGLDDSVVVPPVDGLDNATLRNRVVHASFALSRLSFSRMNVRMSSAMSRRAAHCSL